MSDFPLKLSVLFSNLYKSSKYKLSKVTQLPVNLLKLKGKAPRLQLATNS